MSNIIACNSSISLSYSKADGFSYASEKKSDQGEEKVTIAALDQDLDFVSTTAGEECPGDVPSDGDDTDNPPIDPNPSL